MSETRKYPISCMECRRRKIKCNRVHPCDQCQKRLLFCRFPYTFRRVPLPVEDEQKSKTDSSSTTTTVGSPDDDSVKIQAKKFYYAGSGRFYGGGSSLAILGSVLNKADELEGVIMTTRGTNEPLHKPFCPSIVQCPFENYRSLKTLLREFLKFSDFFEGVSTKGLWDALQTVCVTSTGIFVEDDIELPQWVALLNIIFATVTRQLDPKNPILLQSGLSASELADIFFQAYQTQIKGIVYDSLITMRALILCNRHYYYLHLTENCYTEHFKAVGTAYAIGLHTSPKGVLDVDEALGRDIVWAHLDYDDALHSLSYARPPGINISPWVPERSYSHSPALQQLQRYTRLLRKLGTVKINPSLPTYEQVLSLDADIELELQTATVNARDKLPRDVIFTSARAILHQPYMQTRQYSCDKCLDAITHLMVSVGEMIESNGSVPLIATDPVPECYVYQGFIVLYCFLTYFQNDYSPFLPKMRKLERIISQVFDRPVKWSSNITSILFVVRKHMEFFKDQETTDAQYLLSKTLTDDFDPIYFLDVNDPFTAQSSFQHPFF